MTDKIQTIIDKTQKELMEVFVSKNKHKEYKDKDKTNWVEIILWWLWLFLFTLCAMYISLWTIKWIHIYFSQF